MTYYTEHFEDIFGGEPMEEDLIDKAFDENGYILIEDRMILVTELVGITSHLINRHPLPPLLCDRIVMMWATDYDDYADMREALDDFMKFMERINNRGEHNE